MEALKEGTKQIIQVRNLTKSFGDFKAVKGISFNVNHGQLFAFLGPNGAGKTTTIKMLTTLLSATSGTIKLNGFDPVNQQHEVRNSFGIVFQDPSLDDELTAYENLEFHGVLYNVQRDELKKRITHLLKLVDLYERKDDYVKNFSGGMKRRLEIARGLIHHPKILFLDEPTLGLDPQTRNHLWDYVKQLNKKEGMTVFFTTHYMEEADRMADHIAIIDHGNIILEGTSQEIKKKTKTSTLEEAFLKLTGHAIRDENASGAEQFRSHARAWGRR
jgi:ABC-2 type transport system ATP-binding protein